MRTTHGPRIPESQEEYDHWLLSSCAAFREKWQQETGTLMPYGASRKLPDLLLKGFVRWGGLHEDLRRRLIGFLHVPLDRYTLAAIRNCVVDPEIPSGATMRFIAGATMYNQIQSTIRTITHQAKVPAIYFDILIWDMSHH